MEQWVATVFTTGHIKRTSMLHSIRRQRPNPKQTKVIVLDWILPMDHSKHLKSVHCTVNTLCKQRMETTQSSKLNSSTNRTKTCLGTMALPKGGIWIFAISFFFLLNYSIQTFLQLLQLHLTPNGNWTHDLGIASSTVFIRDVQIYIQNWLVSGMPEQLFK